MKKEGQFQLSFGMIFSVFLIVVFIVVAVIVANQFLKIGRIVETGGFIRDFENEVDRIWKSAGGEDRVFSSSLGKGIGAVCFFDARDDLRGDLDEVYKELGRRALDYEDNLYFYPPTKSDVPSVEIEHLDMDFILEDNNPNCFNVVDGRVEIRLEKGVRDSLVKVRK